MACSQSGGPLQKKCPCSQNIQLVWKAIQIILICFWVFFMRDTDAYYSVYLICAAAAMACVLKNECTPLCDSRKKLWYS